MKIEALCEQGPRAAHGSGPRPASAVRLIVIHSAEATNARGVAAFFAKPSTQASTQLAADGTRCVRMLPDLVIPWGAPGVNKHGLHIEICGYAKWTREQWMQRETMLRRAAWKCARWSWQYDVPSRWLTDAQLRNGERGFTTHAQASKVFPGSGHWDPGPGFPRAWFMGRVREYVARIEGEWQ